MIVQKSYFDSINYFVEYVKMEKLDKKIAAMYLGGSVGRGDFTPGRSDIDIYVINKEVDKGLESKLIAKASEITDKNLAELKKVCDIPFTVAFTTLKEIEGGNSWLGAGSEYFSFVETSKLLLGDDIKGKLPIPATEQIKEMSKQALQMLNKVVNEMPEPIFNDDNKDYVAKGMFECAFTAIHFILSYSGVYLRGKKAMIDNFKKLNNDVSFNKYCEDILSLWNIFGTRSLADIEIKRLINNTMNMMKVNL